eukprot:33047-Hanusia_phi.AAC.1
MTIHKEVAKRTAIADFGMRVPIQAVAKQSSSNSLGEVEGSSCSYYHTESSSVDHVPHEPHVQHENHIAVEQYHHVEHSSHPISRPDPTVQQFRKSGVEPNIHNRVSQNHSRLEGKMHPTSTQNAQKHKDSITSHRYFFLTSKSCSPSLVSLRQRPNTCQHVSACRLTHGLAGTQGRTHRPEQTRSWDKPTATERTRSTAETPG